MTRFVFLGLALSCGCTASQEKPAIDATLSHTELRRTTFEATARSLDDHPEYVDEFYAVARAHPKLLHRFLVNTARDLHEEALARPTAELLVQHPKSLETVLVDTVDETKTIQARAAIARAVAKKHEPMSDVITDSPEALIATMVSSIDFAMKKPAAREALRVAMRERAPELAKILLEDPPTLKILMTSMAKESGQEPLQLIRSLK